MVAVDLLAWLVGLAILAGIQIRQARMYPNTQLGLFPRRPGRTRPDLTTGQSVMIFVGTVVSTAGAITAEHRLGWWVYPAYLASTVVAATAPVVWHDRRIDKPGPDPF